MTEIEWLAGGDPDSMLQMLGTSASARKQRLFAVACCHRVIELLPDERCRVILTTAEQFADGLLESVPETVNRAAEQLQKEMGYGEWKAEAEDDFCPGPNYYGASCRHGVALAVLASIELELSCTFLGRAFAKPIFEEYPSWPSPKSSWIFAEEAKSRWDEVDALTKIGNWHSELVQARRRTGHDHEFASMRKRAAQACLLRDIFGNPFRPAHIDPAWLTWRDGTAVKLAQTIYDDRRFDLLPILADALHEAGCCNDAILDHRRGPGPHVRGCWVVDLVLAKS